MSAPEAPKPAKEQADVGSVVTEAPAKSSSPPPVVVKKEPGTSETSNGKVGDLNPAEICVVIGGNDRGSNGGGPRRAQAEGMFALGTPPPTKSTDSCIGVWMHMNKCLCLLTLHSTHFNVSEVFLHIKTFLFQKM